MSLERVTEYLGQYGLAGRVRAFDASSATVELAAQALGVAPERIAKTLSFLTKEGCVLIVAAGDARVDNGRFKRFFGEKARMLPAGLVEQLTGHPVGGVCPFDTAAGARVYLDASLRRFDTVFPAAGTAHSAAEMTCAELERASRALAWVDICKDWRPDGDEVGEK